MNGSSNSMIKTLQHNDSPRIQICLNLTINYHIIHIRGRKSSIINNIFKYIEQISIIDGTLSD